ncbi:hypothetical protein [Rubrivivax albus]|uniref:Uncharacterized protein n=1 Tax=Rubrivivax albus TaxID=2499835 RepID=A0A437JX36_9BURK|nr:hypothetical protein [Rubrivivax albus]RVT52252.1 hypothetical protein ENE75_07285 [Rubrivivax albus]
MRPRTALAAGVVAVGAAAAVVTLSPGGWVPDPFGPPGGPMVSTDAPPPAPPPPDPFRPDEPKIPVIESGSKAAAALGETIIGKPAVDGPDVVESGTDKARELAGEMLPLDPIPDPFRDHDARLARERAFGADSRFPANPTTDRGVFRFDLVVTQRVETRDVLADFTYHLNSRDGSWVVEGEDVAHLLGGTTIAGAKLSFVLRKPGGDLLVCGSHPALTKSPRACMRLRAALAPTQLRALDARQLAALMDSVARVPQRLGDGPGGGAQGFRGRLREGERWQHLQVWVAPGDSGVRTQVPWLGMGSGVMKDARVQLNRIVRRLRVEGADLDGGDIVLDTLALQRGAHDVSTQNFDIVTAFTPEGIAEANALGRALTDLKAEAAEIDAALRACPDGSAGKACRQQARERMKRLNEHAKQQAQSYADRHGLPVGR